MKHSIITHKIFLWLCVFSLGSLTSCSDDDNTPDTGRSGTEIVNLLKKHLYATDGSVNAAKLDTYQEGEYALIAKNAEEACVFFSQLTGIDAPLKSSYDYEYKFNDEKGNSCKISIKGKQEAVDGLYAVLHFNIPQCSEIKIIHIGTPIILAGTNGEDEDDENTGEYKHGIPVMGRTAQP